MVPVLKESIFSSDSALWENESESMSVKSADFLEDPLNVYSIDGSAPKGKRTRDGVLQEKAMISGEYYDWSVAT